MYESSVGRSSLSRVLPDLLISSQYCAGVPTGTIAPGDSGGPSILRTWNDGEQFTLLGVVSGRHRVGGAFYTFIQHEQVGYISFFL